MSRWPAKLWQPYILCGTVSQFTKLNEKKKFVLLIDLMDGIVLRWRLQQFFVRIEVKNEIDFVAVRRDVIDFEKILIGGEIN